MPEMTLADMRFDNEGVALATAVRGKFLCGWMPEYQTGVDPGFYCFDRQTMTKFVLRRVETHYEWVRP